MTPLEYIASNPSYEESRGKWLVFNAANKTSMLAKQKGIKTNHRVIPTELTDGRWAVCCDVLTELGEKGVYRRLFAALDRGKLNTSEILTSAEIAPLWPVTEDPI